MRAALDAAWEEYEAGLAAYQEGQARYEAGLAEYTANREAYEQGLASWEEGNAQYLAGEESYRASLAQYESSRAEYLDGLAAYQEGEQEYADALAEYEDGEAEYEDGMREYLDGLADYEAEAPDAWADIAEAEEELADLSYPEWYVLDRGTIPSYVEFDQDARSMGNLAKVFPLIFFLVAALVSLTTMTRMVEEERIEIGTLKALGFSEGQIVQKYVFYALSATVTGGVFGILVGEKVLPTVIIMAYKIMYENIPGMVLAYRPAVSVIAVLAAVLCNVIAAVAATNRAMTAVPAVLMRPTGPRAGKRIWLEYITPLWNRLNFSFKSALRNLFRYKKRLIMTVLGIGACMGLMMVGFGLRDSIQDIVNNQYETIFRYSASAVIESDASDAQLEAMRDALGADELVSESMGVYREAVDFANDARTLSGYLFVPEETDGFGDFIGLRVLDTKEPLDIDDGAVITVKMSRLMGLSVGDTFRLTVEGETRDVTVAGIAENYTYHYVFMPPRLYEELFGSAPEANQLLINMTEDNAENRAALGARALDLPAVGSIEFSYELNKTVVNMMSSLDFVVLVLIVSAAMLAFVVLYNLNNIAITERRRELATLKVLGFYDREVAMYVFRENIFLTAAGILVGCAFGYWLFHYVVNTVEIDMMLFGRIIRPMSYVYSIVGTLVFSVMVNAAMVFRIRVIDMVESLKSME